MTQDDAAKSAPTIGSLCFIDRLKRARNFPHNTCAASRHAEMIGKEMLRKEGETTEAESILATVAALYEARTALHEARAALAETRWIPVGERLPEDGVAVWAFREAHGANVYFRSRGGWRSPRAMAMQSFDDSITHWMPLPGFPS